MVLRISIRLRVRVDPGGGGSDGNANSSNRFLLVGSVVHPLLASNGNHHPQINTPRNHERERFLIFISFPLFQEWVFVVYVERIVFLIYAFLVLEKK